ncbi:MAG: uroporphyrinogen decarboxylase family protein [Phycisphaerae bacterium]|nr:uroporphyrinogen decarboxylase family protein [Phycisphaerae bacterium]
MTPYERYRCRLKGEPVDRIPNFDIVMIFAAHYVRRPLAEYYQDYRILVEANRVAQRVFDLDIVQAISDPYREAADFGAKIRFPHDGLPVCEEVLLGEPDNLKDLRPPEPWGGGRMTDRLQAVRRFRREVGGQVPIMGWVEGALAEAADLRGVLNLMTDLYDRPEWLKGLLETCAEVAIKFAVAQVEAGADIVGLGDAIASQIGPEAYREFGLPYEKRIFEAVHEAGGVGRLHICGDTRLLLSDMADSGAEIIDLDWMVDMAHAASVIGDRAALCGNFDPVAVMLQGTPEKVRRATEKCLREGGPRCFSGAGCEIPDGTPAENLLAQAEVLGQPANR